MRRLARYAILNYFSFSSSSEINGLRAKSDKKRRGKYGRMKTGVETRVSDQF